MFRTAEAAKQNQKNGVRFQFAQAWRTEAVR